MKRWILLLFLFLPVQAGAQVAHDTVYVTIEGRLAVARASVRDTTLTIGDTIFYTAVATDAGGDPVRAQFTWSSSQPGLLQIDPETGVAVALAKTPPGIRIEVYLLAEAVGGLMVAQRMPDGTLNWDRPFTVSAPTVETLPTFTICAYLVDTEGYLLGQAVPPPTCPVVFVPRITELLPFFASIPRYRALL